MYNNPGPAQFQDIHFSADRGADGGTNLSLPDRETTGEALREALLDGDVDTFNALRPKQGRIDLSGITIVGKNLEGINFEGCDLTRAVLRDCNLSLANFDRATLFHADLSGSDIRDSHFHYAKGDHIVLQDIRHAQNADFNSAELNYADLTGNSNFTDALFFGAKLNHAKLDNSVFTGADFTGAQMNCVEARNTDLSSTFMQEVKLYGAWFFNTDLSGADLEEADLKMLTVKGETSFSGANLTNAVAFSSYFAIKTCFDDAYIRGMKYDAVNGLGRQEADLKRMLKQANKTDAPDPDQFTKSKQTASTANLIFGIPGTDMDSYIKALELRDKLIGLEAYKQHVDEFLFKLENDIDRRAAGLPIGDDVYHGLWTGDPGTGKNTAAQVHALLLFAFGITQSPEMVYLKREKLIQKHIGHTEAATMEFLSSIKGKFVFVDEAYQFAEGSENDFAKRALGILLTEMENNRLDWCSAWAGYSKEMDQFLETNSGLRSRFNQDINFKNYTPGQLVDIFRLQLDKYESTYNIDILAMASVLLCVQREKLIRRNRGNEFGTARETRTLFESIVYNQPRRTRDEKAQLREEKKGIPKALLTDVTVADLPCEDILGKSADVIDLSGYTWISTSPNGETVTVSYDELGAYLEHDFPSLSQASIDMIMDTIRA